MTTTAPTLALLLSLLTSVTMAQPTASGPPFYRLIRANDLASLRASAKATAGARDARGSTALMYAAAIGSLDAMKLLVEAGAPVNAANDFGATALMWCAGDLAKVRYLLDKGASVTAISKAGRTPLMIAATSDGSVEAARLMLAKGADPKAKDPSGASVLTIAAGSNNLDLVRLLLEKGATADAIDLGGFTALGNAAANGTRTTPLVKLLLDRGATVNHTSIDSVEMMKNGPIGIGRLTPLLLAVGQGNYQTVELLVNAGANVNAQDIRGLTPLMLAIATDHPDPRIIELLLAKGADRNRKSVKGETAADWARKYRHPGVLRALGLPPIPLTEPPLPPATTLTAKAAIERSVNLLQRTSIQFLGKGGCPACHAQHHTGMAVAAAKTAAVKVDWAMEQSEIRATASLRGSLEQTLLQIIDPPPGTDGHVFSLLQMKGADLPPRLATDAMVVHLAAMQRKEGDWPNYGLSRPPLEDGSFPITAKAIRVLKDNQLPGRKPEFQQRIAQAADWLANTPPLTTEDRSMQLLGLQWADRRAPEAQMKQLIALQRANGGWGQTDQLPADAYATGEVLYTLHQTGMAATHPVYRRGVEFLLRTQHPDGSWHVRTRAAGFQPYFESGFPHGHDQWISQSGTAWAVMALAAE